MINLIQSIYTLPEISFVGGETQRLTFSLFSHLGTPAEYPYDATGCTVNFSLIGYNNKIGVPILSKQATIRQDTMNINSLADVDLEPADTAALYGKYIYQLTIKDSDGNVGIPN